MGFGRDASLYSSTLTERVLLLSTFISIAAVDKLGRRPILISGGILMIICQVIVAIILGVKFGENQELSKGYSVLVVDKFLYSHGFGFEKLLTLQVKVITCLGWKLIPY
ncbi:unnamed protein product [Lathyrus oleraceus]